MPLPADGRRPRRLLIAFAPDDEHPDFLSQRQYVRGREEEMGRRGLAFAEVLERGDSRLGEESVSGEDAAALRQRFGAVAGRFLLVLLDNEGRELARSTEATPIPDVFEKAYAAPMERQEVEEALRRNRRSRPR